MVLSSFISRHLPIIGHPLFTQSRQFAAFCTWAPQGLTNLVQLFDQSTGKALPFPMLQSLYNLPANLYAQQAINFTASQAGQTAWQGYVFLHLLIGHPLEPRPTQDFRRLQTLVSSTYQASALRLITNEFWREQQLKIMHRAYLPFSVSSTSTIQQQCPWCRLHRPTLFHRLCWCPYVFCFWDQLENFAATITGYQSCKDPLPLLFGKSHPKIYEIISADRTAWLSTCFMTARRAILRQWTSTTPPTISEMKMELTSLLRKERLDMLLFSCNHSHVHSKWDSYIIKALQPVDISLPFPFPKRLTPCTTFFSWKSWWSLLFQDAWSTPNGHSVVLLCCWPPSPSNVKLTTISYSYSI